MTERPIIMSGDSVRSIIAGTKSMTRRAIKPQPPEWVTSCMAAGLEEPPSWYDFLTGDRNELHRVKCPHGTIGDELYCKETWFCEGWDEPGQGLHYRASGNAADEAWFKEMGWKWKPSIHMPKKAARLWLRITDVRVERVQDISEADAIAEGVSIPVDSDGNMLIQITGEYLPVNYTEKKYTESSESEIIRAHFAALWDSLNAKRGYPWSMSPWVFALSFERIDHD